MAVFTGITLATAIAGASLAVGTYSAVSSAQASKKASKASKQAEGVRREQLALDSARQRRQVSRQAAVARANAISAGVATGSGTIEGQSRTEGITSSLASQEAEQVGVIGQSEKLGFSIFNLNQQIADAKGDAATAGAIQSVSTSALQNSQTIANVGSSVYNYFNPATTVPAANDASSQISGGLI